MIVTKRNSIVCEGLSLRTFACWSSLILELWNVNIGLNKLPAIDCNGLPIHVHVLQSCKVLSFIFPYREAHGCFNPRALHFLETRTEKCYVFPWTERSVKTFVSICLSSAARKRRRPNPPKPNSLCSLSFVNQFWATFVPLFRYQRQKCGKCSMPWPHPNGASLLLLYYQKSQRWII